MNILITKVIITPKKKDESMDFNRHLYIVATNKLHSATTSRLLSLSHRLLLFSVFNLCGFLLGPIVVAVVVDTLICHSKSQSFEKHIPYPFSQLVYSFIQLDGFFSLAYSHHIFVFSFYFSDRLFLSNLMNVCVCALLSQISLSFSLNPHPFDLYVPRPLSFIVRYRQPNLPFSSLDFQCCSLSFQTMYHCSAAQIADQSV